jgi:hypothetical protein
VTVHRLLLVAAVAVAFMAPSLGYAQTATPAAPQQPTQPADGPGGADYLFDKVTARHYGPEPDGAADSTG